MTQAIAIQRGTAANPPSEEEDVKSDEPTISERIAALQERLETATVQRGAVDESDLQEQFRAVEALIGMVEVILSRDEEQSLGMAELVGQVTSIRERLEGFEERLRKVEADEIENAADESTPIAPLANLS